MRLALNLLGRWVHPAEATRRLASCAWRTPTSFLVLQISQVTTMEVMG